MCCFCKNYANFSATNYAGCGCNYNSGCVKPIKNQCCYGYLQNGWGKNCCPCQNSYSGAKNYPNKCGFSCKCCDPKPKCQQKCQNSSLLKIKLEGIIKFC